MYCVDDIDFLDIVFQSKLCIQTARAILGD